MNIILASDSLNIAAYSGIPDKQKFKKKKKKDPLSIATCRLFSITFRGTNKSPKTQDRQCQHAFKRILIYLAEKKILVTFQAHLNLLPKLKHKFILKLPICLCYCSSHFLDFFRLTCTCVYILQWINNVKPFVSG